MDIPSQYQMIRNALPTEVSFGCGGIALLPLDEIEQAQLGYSVTSDGASLCSGEDGAWQLNWLVIGHDTACGDPVFIDSRRLTMPVFTAMHSEGAWRPKQIATSLDTFAKCLEEFSRIFQGRSNPMEREANPVSDEERTSYLQRIAELNGIASSPEFWDALLEC